MDQMSFFPFQYNQYNTKNNLIEKKAKPVHVLLHNFKQTTSWKYPIIEIRFW